MSTKRERSNRDADDSKREGQNTSGQGPTRDPAHANEARKQDNDADKPVKDENKRSH